MMVCFWVLVIFPWPHAMTDFVFFIFTTSLRKTHIQSQDSETYESKNATVPSIVIVAVTPTFANDDDDMKRSTGS